MYKRVLLITLLLLLILPTNIAKAQGSTNPVYIIQPGDTLQVIAFRFGVAVQDLIDANGIVDPGSINAGTPLVIPGLEGVEGVLTTQVVGLGESLTSLSRRNRFPMDKLIQLNRITSPTEIFAGASVIVPEQENDPGPQGMAVLNNGESPLELAARNETNPWLLAETNSLSNPWASLPGEVLFFDDPEAAQNYTPISPLISEFEIRPLPLVQGGTTTIVIRSVEPLQLTGSINGKQLHFFPRGQNEYIALQGIHAMAEIGLTDFQLRGVGEENSFDFSQGVLIKPGYYGEDPPLFVDPATIDQANTAPEEKVVQDAIAAASPEKYWSGLFRRPVDDPWCIKSWYGNRRSYNGGDYDYFHTGVDYGVCANLNIYAPAPGKVVFAGPLTVRGNATIIDHGWGVYSGIWHQASLAVKEGDFVEAGQFIGEIGATGRVTGPHLHWEIWVGGVQVEPLDWLDVEFPGPVDDGNE